MHFDGHAWPFFCGEDACVFPLTAAPIRGSFIGIEAYKEPSLALRAQAAAHIVTALEFGKKKTMHITHGF